MGQESEQSPWCSLCRSVNTDANSPLSMIDTVLPADSLEFCPSSGFHDIFVCGTYKLDDSERTRRGQCLVFRALSDSEEKVSWRASLHMDVSKLKTD